MKFLRYLVIASAIFVALPAQAQITAFKHIVIIVQENRTPDNLFWELCQQKTCNINDLSTYDIKTDNWNSLNNGTVTPVPVDLGIGWDIHHRHNQDWVPMCDALTPGEPCKMDGAVNEVCDDPHNTGGCHTNGDKPEFTYVQRYTAGADILGPYISIALTYGWANLMFESNQGPSFEAHQFIYGATSAPLVDNNENDDTDGIYAAENARGCLDTAGAQVNTIVLGVENGTTTYPCFTHPTLGTGLFGSPKPWRYYTPGEENLWTAPEGILSECGVSNQNREDNPYTACTGLEFQGGNNANVVTDPRRVLLDIQSCHLQSLSWVIPNGTYSDHAGLTGDLGPQWVASIVNTIGASPCQDSGKTYWQDTAIIITWDDWGGWYDHEAPTLDPLGYQLGFRVPLLFVSGYGQHDGNGSCIGYIRGTGNQAGEVLDFGSIANFIEGNFRGASNEGLLGFADARAKARGLQHNWYEDLSDFYNITTQAACPFVPIPTQTNYDASYFINDQSTVLDPDDE